MSCSYGAASVVTAGTLLQRKTAGIWYDQHEMVYRYHSGTTGLTASYTESCNGTGTKGYRTRGFGRTVGATEYRYSADRDLTC